MASQGHAQIQLRLKHDLKARVVASAKANNRSINAEITYQLTVAYRGSYLWAKVDETADLGIDIDLCGHRMDSMAGNS